MTEDAVEAGTLRPTLASGLLPGAILHPDDGRNADRVVRKVVTFHRVEVEPVPGLPDFYDYELGARPLARRGPWRPRAVPDHDDLKQSWEARDLRAAEGGR